MKWLQIHITVDQEQVEFTETLLMSLGAVSVTLDDAEDQALLEPLPGETPLCEQSYCDRHLSTRRTRPN